MNNHFTFPASDFTFQLSAYDQIVPPVYSRRVLIFSTPRQHDFAEVTRVLREGIQSTVKNLPILAGRVDWIQDTGTNTSRWTLVPGQAHLFTKDVTKEVSMDDLRVTNYSESLLLPELLSPSPNLAPWGQSWDVCRIQANFIDGGLLLVISIHHVAMDGTGITKVLEFLAAECCKTGTTLPTTRSIAWNLEYEQRGRATLSHGSDVGSIDRIPSCSILAELRPKPLARKDAVISQTFRITSNALKELKHDASDPSSTRWITSHDALCALIWRCQAKARRQTGLLEDEDHLSIGIPVGFRRMVKPPLSADFLGNAAAMARADLPFRDLVGPNGLVTAARVIRNAVVEIDNAWIENCIGVVQSLKDVSLFQLELAIDSARTTCIMMSYQKFAHHLMNWGPALGTYEAFRLPRGAFSDGFQTVLPIMPDGSWEVMITLEKKVLAEFRDDDAWKKYTSS